MRSDRILDVLTDLKTFARANSMPALAEQLDDTAIVAMKETHDDRRHHGEAAVGAYFGGVGKG